MASSLIPVWQVFQGDLGGTYYVRQIDRSDGSSELWWYGESPGGEFANVFKGTLEHRRAGAVNDIWNGEFQDLPKGRACSRGELTVETMSTPTGVVLLLSGSSFGTSRLTQTTSFIPLPPIPITPFYQGNGDTNITGVWRGDDNGTYYINQDPVTNRVVWFGEHPQAEAVTEPGAVPERWSNIFISEDSNNAGRFHGPWVDVPKAALRNQGHLNLLVTGTGGPSSIRRISIEQTGGFGGTELVFQPVSTDTDSATVQITWTSFELVSRNETARRLGRGDEPFFDIVFTKFDGSTVRLEPPIQVEVMSSGSRSSRLGKNMQPGDIIADPPQLEASEELDVLPVEGGTEDTPLIGVSVTGWEEDNKRTSGYEPWAGSVTRGLMRQISNGDAIDLQRASALRSITYRWGNQDDWIGVQVFTLSMREIRDIRNSGGTRDFPLTFIREGAHYILTAQVNVNPVLDGDCTVRRQ
ncbi:hypothetical protein [Aquimarina megaterium]|uniref:hypothetical protein n=1 Tax=Aquimarina megaterium TaxID=1443666 RepID=UPI0004716333|nr:hypothetical protein [Aquimarina megaterium]